MPLRRVGAAVSDEVRSFAAEHGMWFIALCCGNIWIGWMNGVHALAPTDVWRVLSASTMICTLLVAALYGWRHPDAEATHDRGYAFDWPIAALMALFTLPAAGVLVPDGLLQAAAVGGTIATEIGMAWLFIRWGCYLTRLSLRETVACIFGAHVVGCTVKLLLYYVPSQMVAIPIALLPLVSMFSLRQACRHYDGAFRDVGGDVPTIWCSGKKGSWGPLWKITVFIVVYRLIFNSAKMTGTSVSLSTICCLTEIAVALLILYMMLVRSGSFTFQQVWSLFLVLLGASLMFSVSNGFTDVGGFVKAASGSLLVMFIWLVYADVSHHSTLHPFVVFGIARIAYELPTLVTSGLLVPGALSRDPFFICVLMFCLLAFAVFFFDLRDPTLSLVFSDFQKREEGPAPDALRAVCDAAAGDAGLTARESEVLFLLCQGRTRAYIAETLYLSENTVRGHTQHIYEKLGVHSKTELQRKLGV